MKLQGSDIQDGGIQNGIICCIASKHHFVSVVTFAAILEGNGENYRFTTGTTVVSFTAETGYDENLVGRVMTDKSVKKTFRRFLLVQKSIKRMMVSEMTNGISEVATMVEESDRDVYCTNEQFDDVRNCDDTYGPLK